MDSHLIDERAASLSSQIDDLRVVEQSQSLIALSSVNPFGGPVDVGTREQEVAELYATMLSDAGMEVELDAVTPGRPNLYATLHGSKPGPTLMLAGHLDTVGVNGYDDPFDPLIADGRLYGRGSCDMKAALACFAEVARLLSSADVDFAGTLVVAGTADEEDLMIGSKHFAMHGTSPDFCIVGEPTRLLVCPAHKGQLAMFIRTYGTAVHSSVPHEGLNAIANMGKIISALDGYNAELSSAPSHELCGTGTFSIGVIRGGDIVSMVADYCEMEVDRRFKPGETFDDVLSEYKSMIDAVSLQDHDFRYDFSDPTVTNPALDTPITDPVVTASLAAVEWATGAPAAVSAFTGSTDAPNFGAPAVILGPGSLSQAHTVNEYVELDEIAAATRIYLHAALSILAPS